MLSLAKQSKQLKYNYSFPINMGKKGKRVSWTNFDKRCQYKLGYIVEHNRGHEYIDEKGNESYYKLSRQEMIRLGFLAAAGLTANYGTVRSWD